MTKPLRLSVVLVVFLAFDAAAADATSARQQLDAARATLEKAVGPVKQDPPSNEDLDAALAALQALKAAIDTGAELEQSDLDYAKAALAGRKELRLQREFVEQRRANVKIHDARRALDLALKALTEASANLQAKEPGASEVAAARTAVDAVKKLAEGARPFAKQDPKFAAYLATTDATVERQLKAIDDRETSLAVEKQRAPVEDGRAALKAAVGAIGADATDEQFKAGDLAMAELSKRLGEGQPLELKSGSYQALATKARAELVAAKQKLDAQWTATGLSRLKGQIDPQYKDLLAASRPLRGKPSEDQLAEARTAAIVVRKLLEKFDAEAKRSEAFAQYVELVRRTLIDVESQLEQRSLAAALRDVANSQRDVEQKAPTDEQFQELAAAVNVLEKTLGTVHTQEPLMAKAVADAQWALGQAKKVMAKRRLEVDVDRQIARVEEARKIAAEAMQQLGQPAFGEEQVRQAESAVKLIGTQLALGTALIGKDNRYSYYDGEVKKRVVELDDRLAAKKIVLAAREGRAAIAEALTAAKAKIEKAKAPEGTDADVDAAVQSVEAINKLLASNQELEKQDFGYGATAEKARLETVRINELLELAKQARQVRKKTAEVLAAASVVLEQAPAVRDLHARRAQYDKALGLLKACQRDGTQLLEVAPVLAKLMVPFEGKLQLPSEVMALCAQRATQTLELMKELAPLIKFEDGPKRSFEAGKRLVQQSKKAEALSQYNECIATGRILQHDRPEMAEQKFEVGGSPLSLREVIAACVAQSRALSEK